MSPGPPSTQVPMFMRPLYCQEHVVMPHAPSNAPSHLLPCPLVPPSPSISHPKACGSCMAAGPWLGSTTVQYHDPLGDPWDMPWVGAAMGKACMPCARQVGSRPFTPPIPTHSNLPSNTSWQAWYQVSHSAMPLLAKLRLTGDSAHSKEHAGGGSGGLGLLPWQ
jgi:hypothetical protein